MEVAFKFNLKGLYSESVMWVLVGMYASSDRRSYHFGYKIVVYSVLFFTYKGLIKYKAKVRCSSVLIHLWPHQFLAMYNSVQCYKILFVQICYFCCGTCSAVQGSQVSKYIVIFELISMTLKYMSQTMIIRNRIIFCAVHGSQDMSLLLNLRQI